MQLTDIFNWISPWAFGFAKLSMLFFYRSIFRGTVFNIISWAMIAIVILWTIGFFGAVLFQCGARVHLLWGSGAKILEYCAPGFNIAISSASTDAFLDLIILLMPIYWVSFTATV